MIWEASGYYERIARSLEAARSHAVFVGWQVDSRLPLAARRPEGFKKLLVRLCREKPEFHVYLLMWDFSYFYLFEREPFQSWAWDWAHERIHFVFDGRHPYGASHHEKLVVIDGETAYVGGVDICNDRWDTSRHRFFDARRSLRHEGEEHFPYHDISVRVGGAVAADLLDCVGERWRAVSSIPFPSIQRRPPPGPFRVLISRTSASLELRRPLLVRETEFLYRDLIRCARRVLVIENQYYWSERMNEELIAVLRARQGTGFRVFLVIPAGKGGSLAFRVMGLLQQARLLAKLSRVAKETGTRLKIGCPFAPQLLRTGKHGQRSVYVHSKALVADNRFMAIGSSNFNNRGFRMDTELTLTLRGDTPMARRRIRRCARGIQLHWRSLELVPHQDSWREYPRTLEGRIARWLSGMRLPLAAILDPPIPITYLLRQRLLAGGRRRLPRVLPAFGLGVFLMNLGLSLCAIKTSGALLGLQPDVVFPSARLGSLIAWSSLLNASWVIPMPVTLASLGAGLHLGAASGALTAFCSVWIACATGYALSRVFPDAARALLAGADPKWLERRLGSRRIDSIVAVAISPRAELRSKLAFLGIYSIPFRRFAVAAALISGLQAGLACFAGVLGAAFLR